MKILCVIDHLGSGGAQRQIVNLACGLKGKGHDVGLFIYYPEYSFFRNEIEKRGIRIFTVDSGRGRIIRILCALKRIVKKNGFQTIVAFLKNPSLYTELTVALGGGIPVVVSERSSHFDDGSKLLEMFRRNLHRLANRVVVNSWSHSEWLTARYPFLEKRLEVIYNGVDLGVYQSSENSVCLDVKEELKLLAVGRIGEEKNVIGLIVALRMFREKHGWSPTVNWVGREAVFSASTRNYCKSVRRALVSLPERQEVISFVGERSDIPELLSGHHALIHPSFHEGLPNVVCESLAAGRPVLASNVCDNGRLVKEGERGFLFQPEDPDSIVRAIERLASASGRRYRLLSSAARQYAEKELDLHVMISSYERMLRSMGLH